MRRMTFLITFSFLFLTHPCFVAAQESVSLSPEISVAPGIEEGKKVLVARVTLGRKPLEDVEVAFFVERRFGLLFLGKERTLEDGTAAVPFPSDLPGDPKGELHIRIEVTSPPPYASLRKRVTLGGGVAATSFEEKPFPRALWAPNAPIPLMATIAVLLVGVWSTYAFVIVQLVQIKKGGKS